MRAVRSFWWLVLALPLAAPAPAPTLVAGHAHALADPAFAPDAPAPDPQPADDGIRDVRSWLVPPPPPPPAPEREWGPGQWNPIASPAPILEAPLEPTAREDPPAASPDPVDGSVPDPEAAPGPAPDPEAAPEPLPEAPASDPPAENEDANASEGAACLLCFILDAPRRIGIL